MKHYVEAARRAPLEHRLIAVFVLSGLWYLLQFHLHYEVAAKGVEVFGIAPFADRVLTFVLGE